jgi:mannose-6-phosphate isomerase-like protein (cupin superfamily)
MSPASTLELENRHSGERISLRRIKQGDEIWLELKGSLPPHRQGPPLHVHYLEEEEGHISAGTLTGLIDGRRITIGPGESGVLPRGSAHRWWNEGDVTLEFTAYARPLVDVDRYIQAVFEIMNAGPEGKPPLFYMAHLVLRHERTQAVLVMPLPIQAVVFRIVVAIGTLLGRYRGEAWPGCPARCTGAPGPEGAAG